ncbi:hypothetical protein AQUCO_01700149v1 [Aquilegia coerulea]|uniref:F-box domain-containing protein n=1 Tax=Aquilegia coerulea TaxID=218851 RepID=A0A2G5DLF9_AQUCA|nr:hypothetical protein AQUCO_01700149v1 [Aquilegia coerulea]
MGEKIGDSIRKWEDLEIDVLLTIYGKLDPKDMIMGAPLCCSSWYKVSKDVSLWRHVDLAQFYPMLIEIDEYDSVYDFHFKRHRPNKLTPLINFILARSQGSLSSINFGSISDPSDRLFVSQRCPHLKYFEINLFEKRLHSQKKAIGVDISKLKELEGMEVPAGFIDETTLKQIGKCCPNFIKLGLGFPLWETTSSLISLSLPKLKILDLSGCWISRNSLLVILKGCKELEHLNISRCFQKTNNEIPIFKPIMIDADHEIQQLASRLKEFKCDDSMDTNGFCRSKCRDICIKLTATKEHSLHCSKIVSYGVLGDKDGAGKELVTKPNMQAILDSVKGMVVQVHDK